MFARLVGNGGLPAFLIASAVLWTLPAAAQPVWSGTLAPATIGPGSTSRLEYHVGDALQVVTDLGFGFTLPAGVTIAQGAQASNTCGGTFQATAGGTSISLSGVRLGVGESCDVGVNVTATSAGTRLISTGALTSSAGNSGAADTTLTVVTNRAGFRMAFGPSAVSYRGRSTLTYTIDNGANASLVSGPSFQHSLGSQLRVADPLRIVDGCGTPGASQVTAEAGGDSVNFGGFSTVIPAATACTIEVDVEALAVGELETSTADLSQSGGTGGRASASLSVPVEDVSLSMMLSDLNVPPGGTFEAAFAVRNFDRDFAATDIAFDLPLDSVLGGLTASVPAGQGCGTGSSLTGGSTLSLSGGEVPPEGSCHFVVELTVPPGATPAAATLLTGSLSAMAGGSSVGGLPVQATFDVGGAPTLTVTSSASDVPAGGTFDLTVTLHNPHPVDTATGLAATFDMARLSETLEITAMPASGCGGSGTVRGPLVAINPLGQDASFDVNMSGVSLAPGASCQFSLEITLASGTRAGSRSFGPVSFTGSMGGTSVTGDVEPVDINLVGGPRLTVVPEPGSHAEGSEVELTLRLRHAEAASSAATGIGFSLDLDAVLPGLVSIEPPQFEVCGIGSMLSGTSTLNFSGGTLVPGQSCTVGVTVRLPADAPGGDYAIATSDVTSSVGGVLVTSAPALGSLSVEQGLVMSLAFVEGSASPGETITARYTLTSLETANPITDIVFSHPLSDAVTGAAPQVVGGEVCGAGSSLAAPGGDVWVTGGNLGPGESCSFDVVWQLPTTASVGRFPTRATSFSATLGGVSTPLTGPGATLSLVEALSLRARFSQSRALVGSTVDLIYELTNDSRTLEIDSIAFDSDFDDALAGLFAQGLPLTDPCGVGSALAGGVPVPDGNADEFFSASFTDGSLAPGQSCEFAIQLQIPNGVGPGALANFATSAVTAQATPPSTVAFAVGADAARDSLRLGVLTIESEFLTEAVAGETVELRMTLTNGDGVQGYSDISVVFDLHSVVAGMVLSGDPPLQPCGPGSFITGSSALGLSGASLEAGGSCTFVVQALLPDDAPPGEGSGTPTVEVGGVDDGTAIGVGTDDGGVQEGGAGSSDPPVLEGTVLIVVTVPPPTLTRTLSRTTLTLGETATLRYVVDNARGNIAASGLGLLDTVPAGLALLPDAVPTSTCADDVDGASVTFTPPDGVSLSGGRVGARGSCQLAVEVEAVALGSQAWPPATLTSIHGDSNSAPTPFEVVEPLEDGGAPMVDAAMPIEDAGAEPEPEPDAGSDAEADAGAKRGGGGCSIGHGPVASHWAAGAFGMLLLLASWRRRRNCGHGKGSATR